MTDNARICERLEKFKIEDFESSDRMDSMIKSPQMLTLRLCLMVTFLFFLPSEPYLSELLTSDKDFTEDQVNNDIYPFSTYAYLPSLVLLGFISETISYRLAIGLGLTGYAATMLLLLFTNSLASMQLMQVTYSLGMASDDAFSAFVYTLFDPSMFQDITSYVSSTKMLTTVLSGLLGDVLIVVFGATQLTLLKISNATTFIAIILAYFVVQSPKPTARKSDHHHQLRGANLEEGGKVGGNEKNIPITDNNNKDAAVAECHEYLSNTEETDTETILSDVFTHLNDKEGEGQRIEQGPSMRNTTSIRHSTAHSHNSLGSGLAFFPSLDRCRVIIGRFVSQMRRLKLSLMRPNARDDLIIFLWWIVAGGVFMIVYGYEVSIYQELNGNSNRWNGSVIGVMCLAGATGSMLPVWLKVAEYRPENVTFFIFSLGLFSSLLLVAMMFIWDQLLSMLFFVLYIGVSRCIGAVFFARLAVTVSDAAATHLPGGPQASLDTEDSEDNCGNSDRIGRGSGCRKSSVLAKRGDGIVYEAVSTRTKIDSSLSSSSVSSVNTQSSLDDDGLVYNEELRVTQETAEAPYSIAIIGFSILSVAFQIVAQSVLFSWMQLNLRMACLVLSFVHVLFTLLSIAFVFLDR